MKLVEIRLPQELDKSFIFYHELNNPFAQLHNHPEYELVLVTNCRGKRTVGDRIERFEDSDLVFMGPYIPHEWLSDKECYIDNVFTGECIVIQFDKSFLNNVFFELPENKPLKRIFEDSSKGCKFLHPACDDLKLIMKSMVKMDNTDRLYTLFKIFHYLSKTNNYETLSTPYFIETFQKDKNEYLKKCVQYILQHFQYKLSIKKMLEISHMSNSAFHELFTKTYRMSFKEFLLRVRIGYACRLLIEDTKGISTIAYESGFENISNFNRQFKKIKKVTPSKYKSNPIIDMN